MRKIYFVMKCVNSRLKGLLEGLSYVFTKEVHGFLIFCSLSCIWTFLQWPVLMRNPNKQNIGQLYNKDLKTYSDWSNKLDCFSFITYFNVVMFDRQVDWFLVGVKWQLVNKSGKKLSMTKETRERLRLMDGQMFLGTKKTQQQKVQIWQNNKILK